MGFGVLGLSDNEIGILLYQSEAGKSSKLLIILLKYNFTRKRPTIAIICMVMFNMISL